MTGAVSRPALFQNPHLERLRVLSALFLLPFVLGVCLSMKVAPKVNTFSEANHWCRAAPTWKRLLYGTAPVTVGYPVISGHAIYFWLTGQPPED